MSRLLSSRLTLLLAVLALTAAIGGAVYLLGLRQGIVDLSKRGTSDLSLAADRLTTQLQRYGQLAVLLTDHPAVRATFEKSLPRNDLTEQTAAEVLRATADKTASHSIAVLDRNGTPILRSDVEGLGIDHGERPYFKRAMSGALGSYHMVGDDGRRLFLYAAPVFSAQGPVQGVVLVAADIEVIERDWRGDTAAVFFTDELGVAFVSNRSELVLRQLDARGGLRSGTAEYSRDRLTPFPQINIAELAGQEVWEVPLGPYIPERALHLVQPLPVIGLTGEALIDIAPVIRVAGLQAAFACAVVLLSGLALVALQDRRRTLAKANAALEDRVHRRTAELQRVNSSLRAQIMEREEAESALRRAQADLVEAGKLSALGQMSAGISHELNQPLMAIGSFAENGQAFLAKGDAETAAQNLSRIAELSRRAGRIIKNLRAFVRNEAEPLSDVILRDVLDAALDLLGPRITTDAVAIEIDDAVPSASVRAGDVRLEQVFVNLIGNALDAMSDQAERKLHISISVPEPSSDSISIAFHDSGPGLDGPDRIFEPFYTTKKVGEAQGMGLGLSISYGLIQSFGGQIKGSNHPAGGAVLTVTLPRIEQVKAA